MLCSLCYFVSHVVVFADVQGTVIRVFSVPDGHKLYEFRRSVKR